MDALARRVGLADSDALVERILPIATRAAAAKLDPAILDKLKDKTIRTEIIERMQADVCLRTNPLPLDDGQLERFLDLVIETVVGGAYPTTTTETA